jgi:selenocysteine lyase/cysteine desulfurase
MLGEYNQKGLHGKKRIKQVNVSGASNVLGTINDLEEIGRIVHLYGAHLLVDAAQLVAHRKIEMEKWGIDYLAFSAHKVYAPFGCGVLVAKKRLINFSETEQNLIKLSGEENKAGIAALGKALLLLQRIGMDLIKNEEQALTKIVLRGMNQVHGLKVFGIKDPESPSFLRRTGVIVFSLKSMMPNRIAKNLANHGIGVRYGCHCAHLLIKRLLKVSPFLEQFQGILVSLFPKIALPGLVRVSFGIENSEKDIDILIRVLGQIAEPQKNTTNIQKQIDDWVSDLSRKVFVQQNNLNVTKTT